VDSDACFAGRVQQSDSARSERSSLLGLAQTSSQSRRPGLPLLEDRSRRILASACPTRTPPFGR
jgi:hypothetical protein